MPELPPERRRPWSTPRPTAPTDPSLDDAAAEHAPPRGPAPAHRPSENRAPQNRAPQNRAPQSRAPGDAVDNGRGRVFPCQQCGADLEFSIGQQQLECPYCGSLQALVETEQVICENDFYAALERLRDHDADGLQERAKAAGIHEIRCDSCGANVVFQGTLTSTACPYCASPLQRDQVHDCTVRIRVDGVLPFQVPVERAQANLRQWIGSLWFAPNDFKKQGVQGKFNGCYLPFFTFDAETTTDYTGRRGNHYYVTVKQGNSTRTERRTNWTPVAGQVARSFDDVLILALKNERADLLQQLEPWPLAKLQPFSLELLAGFFARTYDVPLEQGLVLGKQRMDAIIHRDILMDIGGDEQRVTERQTDYRNITFKHLLLPVWLMAYRYRDRAFLVTINAATGEVQGDRPYSWVKITLFVLFWLAIAFGVWALVQK